MTEREQGIPVEAGRELDGVIAERVMGFVGVGYYGPTKASGGHQDYLKCATWAEAKALYDKHWPADVVADHVTEDIVHWKEGWGPLFIPAYSTVIAAAWEVVAKMGNWHGFGFIVQDWGEGFWEAGWYEQSHEGPESRATATGETPQLAICRAALLAASYDAPSVGEPVR